MCTILGERLAQNPWPVLLGVSSTWVGVWHTRLLDDATDGVARTIADRGLLCALQGGAWGSACVFHGSFAR